MPMVRSHKWRSDTNMRAIRTTKRPDDMPLFGTVQRVKPGLYEVVIKFVKSHRTLHVERIGAPNVTAVKLFFRLEYPTMVWGKPKPSRPTSPPNIKQEKVRATQPRAKEVLRKRKKSVRRKVRNPLPIARRRNPQAGAEL